MIKIELEPSMGYVRHNAGYLLYVNTINVDIVSDCRTFYGHFYTRIIGNKRRVGELRHINSVNKYVTTQLNKLFR